ncbi:MAG: hypothetical protein OXU42_10525 [Deltaproteobacteria bacterium]|nr:hypothetical protein [Deltaproteobacteria bacterium]
MSKMIQLRNVPDELHRILKSRAALAGMSLSDYSIAELARHAEHPTLEDLCRRLRSRPSFHPTLTPTRIIREERDRP